MRLFLKERSPGQIEFGLIYGVIALLALCAARFRLLVALLPSCAFKGITGVPCPTCGSTRAFVHLAHGEVLASLAMNPAAAFCMLITVPYFFYSLITRLFRVPRVGIALTEHDRGRLRAGAIVAAFINWGYLVMTR